jgi:tRNA pseudouridine38-40 synthase
MSDEAGHAVLPGEPSARRTVALRVAYDGSSYHGVVLQRGPRTVASDLLAAITTIDPRVEALRVASRTDAGVHARDQLIAFDTDRDLPMRAWVLSLGKLLPDSVAVRGAYAVPFGFHPRFETVHKRYRYLLHCERVPDPLLARRAWRVHALEGVSDATVAQMDAEIALCRGTHDFAAFASAADVREKTERTMFATAVERLAHPSPVLAIDICGNGFLHHMVRIVVGTVVDVALGRIEPGAIARALAGRDRRLAGQTAPAEGLCLEEVRLSCPLSADRWP